MESAAAERRTERPAGLDASTMAEAFQLTARDNAGEPALRTKDDSVALSWGEYAEKVEKLAAGLAALGLERGQTIGLMLTNRPEFHLFDAAAMHLGATPFSVYNTYAPEQIEYLAEDADNKIFVTEQEFLDRIQAVEGIEHVIVVDGEGEGTLSIEDVEAHGEEGFDFEAAWRAVEPDDVLTLIYTSGTTGPPKGVQITHDNMLAASRSYDKLIAFPQGGRIVSYLPMAHVAERNVSQYLPMICGFSVTCCPDARQVASYLPDVHPSWFFAVPRIWEKLKAGLEAMLAGPEDEEQKAKLTGALDRSLERVRLVQAGEQVPDELEEAFKKADSELFAGLRTMLGLDQLEACNVGAAPTPPEVIEFFHALGVPLAELWGMSETTGAGCCNPPEHIKIGTVGPPAPDCEITLAEDGEVLIRGPFVFPGYRNLPDKTRETFDDEGWLRTGDIGEFDDEGYLKIVDRKKELIINAAGKNMSPANIEAKIKSASPLIGQAVAIGDGRPYNVALITVDPDTAPGYDSREAMEKEVAEGVERANEELARVEQIKKFKLLDEEWEPGGDELTPTMKLKRKPIAEKYADEIDALYS
ncbi:MAG TPA: AMP-binding protein [Thermoleophilaceae bacterium]|jgi:long-subunit acyl-CoA synthetase (AMP-forming)